MRSDDFSAKTINALKLRVNLHCSNPDCQAWTSGPNTDPMKATNGGEASHICAASPEGPRYDQLMSHEARISIDNAIWLCKGCARKIDVDAKRYPVELLKEWKKKAEAAVLENHGKPLEKDRSVEILTQALTGNAKEIILNALPNVIEANKKLLEIENPGLSINTSFKDGVTHYQISAKAGARLKPIHLIPSNPDEAITLIETLDKGLPYEGKSPFTFSSELPFFGGDNYHITLDPDNKIEAEIRFFSTLTPQEDLIVPAILRGGPAQINTSGDIGNILKVNFRHSIENKQITRTCNLNLTFGGFHLWEDKELENLPHFNKLLKLANIIKNEGAKMEISIEGSLLARYTDCTYKSDIPSLLTAIQSLGEAIKLANKMALRLKFRVSDFANLDIKRIEQINNLLDFNNEFQKPDFEEKFDLPYSSKDLPADWSYQGMLFFRKPIHRIRFFGILVQLPAINISISNTTCKIIEQDESLKRLEVVRGPDSVIQVTCIGQPLVISDDPPAIS